VSTTKRLDYIDFCKGFSILSIVIFHYFLPYSHGITTKALMLGGTGVHVFFLLSGFGLAISKPAPNAMKFYGMRFRSILIPYYLIIILIYATNPLSNFFPNDNLYAFGGHIFFYKMFDEKIIGSFGYPFWFISTIIQFYILYPVLQKANGHLGEAKFLMISLASSLTYWLFIALLELDNIRIYNSFFLQYLWEFSLGIVLGQRYKNTGEIFWDHSPVKLLIYAVVFLSIMGALVTKGGNWGRTINDMPALIGYLSFGTLIFQLSKDRLPTIKNAIVNIGKISYEIYLLHIFLFLVTKAAMKNLPWELPEEYFVPTFALALTITTSNFYKKFLQNTINVPSSAPHQAKSA